MATTKTHTNGRRFEGPFIILGMAPSWPAELERRKGFAGAPHTFLSSLVPMGAAQPQIYEMPHPEALQVLPKPVPAGGGGVFADKYLKGKLTPWFLGKVERATGLLQRPRTVKQLARALNCSTPIVYALLELLRRRDFPLKVGQKGHSKTYTLVLSPSGKAPKARA